MQDGNIYDQEGLEPVLLPRSSFLTVGESHQKAVALLDEFLQKDGEKLVSDPQRRAILQRDLWAIFQTTADCRR